MADDSQFSRTEEPTERRRDDARKKGQFPVSSELASGMLLLSGVMVFWFSGGGFGGTLLEVVRAQLLELHRGDLTVTETQSLLSGTIFDGIKICGLLFVILFLAGVATGLMQVGFNISFEPLAPNWERLSPVNGWKRLFSSKTIVKTLISLAKASAVLAVFWWMASSRLTSGDGRPLFSLADAVGRGWEFAIHFSIAVAAFLTLIALLDVLFQRWSHERDLKMSRQELKDEHKREEGDPLMRARIKKLQRELAQRKMLDDVPRATVVLTNPTHIAIALMYDRNTMAAPRVVAKGKDFLAKRIVKIATENDIPVLERKPLARALYAAVPLGQEIPNELYQAIAEILVYVYRLKRAA